MTARLGDRLKAARRRHFVGREAEKQLFQAALTANEPPFFVLHIYGPGGVGKTSLLHEFARLAEQSQVQPGYLDARNLEAVPDSFLVALAQSLGLAAPADPLPAIANYSQRLVILVDTYELLAPLDTWLRDIFLPELPATALFVVAGRNPPTASWRADPGWQSLVQVLPLRNLTPAESHAYLNARTVAAAEHALITKFTHGHPLAISLVADVLEQRPELHFEPTAAPDIVRALLERFVQEVPSPAHRFALEATAMVRQLTEGLLATMLAAPDVHELFTWLRGLSFIDAGRQGIFPHDLVRDAMSADLRWRNPDWYAELHKRARTYYMERLHQTQGSNQRRILQDFVYLHRDNFLLRPFFDEFFEEQDGNALWIDRLQPADIPGLLTIVRQHEGEESARLIEQWLTLQPQGVTIVRDGQRQVQGFLLMVSLEAAPPAALAADPATHKAWEYLQRHAPLRPGESAIFYRSWMASESYQEISAVQARIFLICLQYYLTTPGLAFTFFACVDPDFWEPIFTYGNLLRLRAVDFNIGGQLYGVYGHDWRVTPPPVWLDLMAEREIAADAGHEPPRPPVAAQQPLLVLSEPDFANAVREALRTYTRATELQTNPLLRSRLVVEHVRESANAAERVVVLQKLLKEAAERLQASPRQNKLYRALYHTYIKPAATQELAAELIDVPFSSYRRHLKAGLDAVIEDLWQHELNSQPS